jgi:hypothetical protein
MDLQGQHYLAAAVTWASPVALSGEIAKFRKSDHFSRSVCE